MITSPQARNACSKATPCRRLSIGFLQLACITGDIFCVLQASEGQRKVSEERETRGTEEGVRLALLALSLYEL